MPQKGNKIMKNDGQVSVGDYVLATKYSDGDPQDQWAVGFVSNINADRFYVVDSQGTLFRASGFRRAQKITKKQGEKILKNKQYIELSCNSLWNWLESFKDMENIQSKGRGFRKPPNVDIIVYDTKDISNYCNQMYGTFPVEEN